MPPIERRAGPVLAIAAMMALGLAVAGLVRWIADAAVPVW